MTVVALALASPARALATESARPVVSAVRVAAPPVIDGRLDDAAWAATPATCGFRQRDPREAAPASEDTCVVVGYDGEHLYVGIRAHDREPARVIGRIRRRDRVIDTDDGAYAWGDDDAVAVAIDTFRDGRNAFVFATNPEGAAFDALVADESPVLNHEWRTVFTVRSARHEAGWSTELAIPWRSLRYPAGAGPHRFGFDVFRLLRRRHEESALSAWARGPGGLHRASAFATLEGLADLPRPPLNLELLPYTLAEVARVRGNGAASTALAWRFGLDAKWEARPGLVLDATVAPDFSQIELDPLELNLDPYPLFFPEKRPFFLENAGVFELGTRGYDEAPPFLMFFSRRIGYGAERLLPVHGGLRLSGRGGGHEVGALAVFADAEPTTNDPPRALGHAALRYKHELAGGYVGVMLTEARPLRDRTGLASQTALGLDAAIWPLETLRLAGFYARTGLDAALATTDRDAHHLTAQYDDGTFSVDADVLGLGAAVDPALGFVARPGVRRFLLNTAAIARPERFGVRELELYASALKVTRPDLAPLDHAFGVELTARFSAGPRTGFWAWTGADTVDELWQVAGVIPADPGRYPSRWLGAHAASNPAAALVGLGHVSRRDAFGGRFDQVGAELRARFGAVATFVAAAEGNRIGFPRGRADYVTTSARLEIAPTTQLTAGLHAQHRSLDDRVSGQLRFVYTYLPGSDLVLVLSDDRAATPTTPLTERRAATIKISWLGRL